jgi:hypothetical protein
MEYVEHPPTPLEGIPDILYKYRTISENTFDILQYNRVYLPSPDQFNDPFDCAIPFKYKPEDLTEENVYIKLRQLGRQIWPEISEEELEAKCYERQKSGAFESGEYWKAEHEYTLKELNRRFGVLSLTYNPTHQLMWSHYTDSHKGICVGFDKFKLYKSLNGTLGRVIYSESNEFPTLGLFDESDRYLIQLLFTKSNVWKYEDEFRLVVSGGSRKIFKLISGCINTVYLGCKISDRDAQTVLDILRTNQPTVRVFQLQASLDKFELIEIPLLT